MKYRTFFRRLGVMWEDDAGHQILFAFREQPQDGSWAQVGVNRASRKNSLRALAVYHRNSDRACDNLGQSQSENKALLGSIQAGVKLQSLRSAPAIF